MINLMLLPFRGLVWLVLGCIFSLPWLLILLPVTISTWLPLGLSYGLEKLTGFPCKIEKAEVKMIEGEITLHNVILSNPEGFYSSDFLKFSKVDISLNWTSLLSSTVTLRTDVFNKGCLIEDFGFNFKGLISLRMYMGSVRANEFLLQKKFSYTNVCLNVPEKQKELLLNTQSFENVYNAIGSLFNHVGE